jgi:LPXTG-motif cell wall-anchored protein
MARTRLPFTLFGLLCLLALAPAASGAPGADTEAATADSGGTLADPLRQGEGGGGVAPKVSPDPATAELNASPPEAQATQEPMPTTPEGEQQPGGQQPGEEQPPTTEEQPAPDEGTTVPADEQPTGAAEGGEAGGGFLPSTGRQIAALAVLGLGLLLAGVTLKPRRRVGAGARR